MEIKKVGVVGCGLMGGGIAQVSAVAGYQVVASEVSVELLDKGIGAIKKNLSRSVDKGKMTSADMEATLSRLKGTTSMTDFADCDLVIEAVVENIGLKHRVFGELDKICPPSTILATNTSCLSIMDIARITARADKVLGIHFFNPVPAMRLVELVKTITTSDEIAETAKKFAESLGKTVVEVPDVPGFIVNRLSNPFILHAIRMLENGVAPAEAIDAGCNLGLNHPMGPLALADLVGLDTVLFIADAIYAELKDPMFIAPTLLRKMVTAGWLGRKTGRGFYNYSK